MELNLNICPICETPTIVENLSNIHSYRIDCPRCGKFQITDSALIMFQRSKIATKILSLSFTIRNNQAEGKRYFVNESILRRLLVPFEPLKPKEQANRFLVWMGDSCKSPEDEPSIELNSLIPIIGASSQGNVKYVIHHVFRKGWINTHMDSGSVFQGHLTFDGWELYETLKVEVSDSKSVFMAMKFGKDNTDKLFNEILVPAVKDTGFELKKLDDGARMGLIDNRMRVEIRKAKFLISDLTHDNPGAYFEAGFTEGLGKEVLYICEKEKFKNKKTHFDTNHHLTLVWDLENPEDFIQQLKATIRETFPADARMED